MWAHSVATQLQPDLLDDIPTASIISSTTVVETTTGENGDEAIIKTTTVTDDADSTADENSTDVVTDNDSRVGGGEDDIDGDLKVTSGQISPIDLNNIVNNTNNCINSNSNTPIKQNLDADAKIETEDSNELTELQPPVLNGNNTASSATEQSDESNLEQPVQVIAANGNNKNGTQLH